VNISALAELIRSSSPEHLLLICAGTGDRFSLEDAIGAGALLANLNRTDYLDPAALVHSLFSQVRDDLETCLCHSQNGRALLALGKEQDIRDCGQLSVYDTVGILRGEAVVSA
jgi:2-phosphosulfolactate phosphatase